MDNRRAKETGGQWLFYHPINPTPPISFLFNIEKFLLFYWGREIISRKYIFLSAYLTSGNLLSKSSFNYVVNSVILAKSLAITIILAVVFAGLGHIYLGYKKRGVIILVARVAIWLAALWFLPFPIDWIVGPIVGGGFWIWQLIDVVRLYNRTRSAKYTWANTSWTLKRLMYSFGFFE